MADMAEMARHVADAVRAREWRHVVQMTWAALSAPVGDATLGDLVHTLVWWYVRHMALLRLQLWQALQHESDALWVVLDSVQVRDGDGETLAVLSATAHVPYALHVLRAHLLFVRGAASDAVELLWYWIHHARYMISCAPDDDAQRLWQERSLHTTLLLVSLLAGMGQVPTATTVLRSAAYFLDADQRHDPYVELSVARLYLQLGDLDEAHAWLTRVRAAADANGSDALKAAWANHEALWTYTQAPHDASRARMTWPSATSVPLENTKALDAFYNGDVGEATRLLEACLAADAGAFSASAALCPNILAAQSMRATVYVVLLMQTRAGPSGGRAPRRAGGRRRSHVCDDGVIVEVCIGIFPPPPPHAVLGVVCELCGAVRGGGRYVAVAHIVGYWQRARLWQFLSPETQELVLAAYERVHTRGGRMYERLTGVDWDSAARAGLTSQLFDIEANIRDGDTRAGLDEQGTQEVHRLMQELGLVRGSADPDVR